MSYQYQEIDEHIQWLINFMKEEYPNDFELVIDSSFAKLRSTLITRTFLREDIRNPGGLAKATEKTQDAIIECLKKDYQNIISKT